MQDRYVCDVGDFAKYGLLRRLAGEADEAAVRLGVLWYYFPDESHNGDGRHLSYLKDVEFAGLDDTLREALGGLVESRARSIAAIARSGVLPSSTVYCDSPIFGGGVSLIRKADRLIRRGEWLSQCLSQTEHCDLIFFDPDNGLEVASVSISHPKAGKYVFWHELKPFWKRRQSLLIYHHLNRTKPATVQVTELAARMRTEFPGSIVSPLLFRRGSCRVFWLVSPQHALGGELERRAVAHLTSGWSKHFWSLERCRESEAVCGAGPL